MAARSWALPIMHGGAMRLSALMGQRVIYVMTHDSIGLGEDGPTHQPVEHLAMLRATPNLNVFRPADIIETAEAWEIALATRDKPSVLVLSRQALPMLRERHSPENRSARGAYVLREVIGPRDLTLLATGSEVQIAKAAAEELFAGTRDQGRGRLHAVMGAVRSPERANTASRFWAPRPAWLWKPRPAWAGTAGSASAATFVGMNSFGASAPAEALYPHFGITAEAVAEAALGLIAA